MTDLAIQIVNYNTKSYLIRCLDGLLHDLENASFTYRILVLDNDSGDDLLDLAPRYGGRVEFHRAPSNRGFGAGHNLLAGKAASRHILVLNPDLEFIEARTVERLLQRADADPSGRRAVVGPRLMNAGGVQRWDHGELAGFWGWVSERIGGSHWFERAEPADVAWVSGAVFLIRRPAFDEAGGFDEKFFLYKEEEDLCRRLRAAGHAVFYDPGIRVFHHGSVVASKAEFFDVSDRYFLEKHFRQKGALAFMFLRALQQFKHRFVNPFLYR